MDFKQLVIDDIKPKFVNSEITFEEIESLFTEIPDLKNGDVCVPCFTLAKKLRNSPQNMAQALQQELSKHEYNYVTDIQAVSGYLNFFVNKEKASQQIINNILTLKQNYGKSEIGKGKTVCIDYSSINLAKFMHIGHLKTTMLGWSLYNIHKFLGYNVVGINYVGDYGTPFGKIIVAIKKWGDMEKIKQNGVDEIQSLYVKFNQESEHDESLNDQAREWFRKIENGDKEALELFNYIITSSITEAERTYDRLGVVFDSWRGENYYSDKMQPIIDELVSKNLLVKSEGADIVDLNEHNLGVALVRKSDGTSLYVTRDLAAAQDRYDNYKYSKSLYVTSVQQKLHFERLFKIIEIMDKPYANTLEHIYYGTISLPTGKIGSRYGKQALIRDLITSAYETALDILKTRGTKHEDLEKVANQIAAGTLAFEVVRNEKLKDTVFDLESSLSFEGETSPYMQYTFARTCSIISKALRLEKSDEKQITEEAYALVKLLNKFESVVLQSANDYEPCYISKLLLNICSEFNKFYNFNRIIENDKVNVYNLNMTQAVNIVLNNGLKLLGIEPIEKM